MSLCILLIILIYIIILYFNEWFQEWWQPTFNNNNIIRIIFKIINILNGVLVMQYWCILVNKQIL